MRHRLFILMCSVLWLSTAAAQNIGFLNKGPIAYLDDDDRALLKKTLKQALENTADGESVTWDNPKSGNHGQIEILDTHEDYGTTCRTVRTNTTAGGRKGGGIYRLCREKDDTWRFAPRRRKDPS